MSDIDRKFQIKAVSRNSGQEYDETCSVLFKAADPALPGTLNAYFELCKALGCDELHLASILLLMGRVQKYQEDFGIQRAGVETDEEAARLLEE
jgi:hypothetical protein